MAQTQTCKKGNLEESILLGLVHNNPGQILCLQRPSRYWTQQSRTFSGRLDTQQVFARFASETARVDLIGHVGSLLQSMVWTSTESEGTKVFTVPATHTRENLTGIVSADPEWKLPKKIRGMKEAQSFQAGRILNCLNFGGLAQNIVAASLTIQTTGENSRTHVRRAGLPFLPVGVYHM